MIARLPMTLAAVGALAAACEVPPHELPDPEPAAGAATVYDTSADAFGRPFPGLDRDQERAFFRGRALFRDDWVQAPSSTITRDGLGPLFNARSCEACHVRDGRGRPPAPGEVGGSLLYRLSVPGASADEAPRPDPRYGGQLQPLAILGATPEAVAAVDYEERKGSYPDGEAYALRVPTYSFTELAYGEMAADVMVSPRVAPAMHGLGLLEAVSEDDILALADPEDADGDGISGRPNYVSSAEDGAIALGRFGWKANQPSLLQQSAGAFLGDIGITSWLFPDEGCAPLQDVCAESPSGGDPELVDVILEDVVFYARTLAVPSRRSPDAAARDGERLFGEVGCTGCHTESLRVEGFDGVPELAGTVIFAYTDLLLHDMGPELADGRPDFAADGREWRTPPLWGIGLQQEVNGHTFFLHDGRARSLEEAILWHGGEAQASAQAFKELPEPERRAVLRFLETL